MLRKMNIDGAIEFATENNNASKEQVLGILLVTLRDAVEYIEANVENYTPDDISNEVYTEEFEIAMVKLGKTGLIVAKGNIYNGKPEDWAAYFGNIERSREEWPEVCAKGDKIPHSHAKFLFPEFEKKYAWRS